MSSPNSLDEARYIGIDEDVGIDYRDSGRWRSYRLRAGGSSYEACLADAGIEEVDQDGGTIDCYQLCDAPSEVEEAALRIINEKWRR